MLQFGTTTITYGTDVDTLRFGWGDIQMLSEERVTGVQSMSFGWVVLQPGKGHVRHNHPDSDEYIFVVSGEGEQMLNDEDPVVVKSGACITIPKGVFHSTVNTGSEPLTLVVVYAPAGAEQVLREAPDVQIIPPQKD